MSLGRIVKQSSEFFTAGEIVIDWDNDLGSTETISSATAAAYDEDGNDVTSTVLQGATTINGTQTSVALTNGTDGARYYVEHEIVTSAGSIKAEGFWLLIKDEPTA